MYSTLLELEKEFFKLSCISDREWLNDILHEDFKECGKSGVIFDKKETVESLNACRKDRDIQIYNFEYTEAGDSCCIVHYITKDGDEKYYRTSVWKTEMQTRLLFHQATRLNMEVDLVVC